MFKTVAFCFAVLVVRSVPADAQSGAGVPWEDRVPEEAARRVPDPGHESHARDVNDAPLFVLGDGRAWGRAGASRVAAARVERPIASKHDFEARTGLRAMPDFTYGGGSFARWDWGWRSAPGAGLRSRAWRLRWRRGAWSAPVRIESDGGRERTADRTTAAVAWRRGPDVFVIGHYDLRWGNGFLVDSSPGWGTPARPAADRSTRLRPYDSRVENRAFFGPAFHLQRGRARFGLALSRHRRDARIDADGLASSWDDSGYHRTESERRSKATVRESFATAHAGWERAGAAAAAAVFHASYDPAWSGGNETRKPDAFRGSRASGASLSVAGRAGDLHWTLEAASTGGRNGAAFRGSVRVPGTRAVQLELQRLGRRYHAVRSGARHRLRSAPRGQESALLLARSPSRLGAATWRVLLYRSIGRTFFEQRGEAGTELRLTLETGGSARARIPGRWRFECEVRREWESGQAEDRLRGGLRARFHGRIGPFAVRAAPFVVGQREVGPGVVRRSAALGAVTRFGPLRLSLVRLLVREGTLVLPAVALGNGFPARAYGRTGGLWRARWAFRWDAPGPLEASALLAEGEWGIEIAGKGGRAF